VSSAFQQIVTPLPGGAATAISGSAELELGARGMLILLDGVFRLDACPMGDTLKLVVRGLGDAALRTRSSGYGGAVIAREEQFERLRGLRPSSFELAVEIRDGDRRRRADIAVGALQVPDCGRTRLTAQAIVKESEPG
jgi:hypothetical protein